MSEMRTEEEQVEAIKNWWKSNGRSLLVGIAVALAIVFGWKGWEQRQEAQAVHASVEYQNLLDAVLTLRSKPDDKGEFSTAKHLASTLKSDFADSGYASMAALLMARVSVDRGDYDAALKELDWVQKSGKDADLKQIALLRSARVKLAQGDAKAAQALLQGAKPGAYGAEYDELRGDVLAALGQKKDARAAYDKALKSATPQLSPIIQMKRDDLAQGDQS